MMTESKQNVSPDWRGLCEELTEFVARLTKHYYEPAELLIRARAALAQPEAEVVGPTDEELLSLDQLRDAWNAQADAMNSWTELGVDEIVWWAQHQALARWGRPSPAPAGDSALRDAAQIALTTLEGWSNYDQWVWPISAMEQAKRGTTEALDALKTALSRTAPAPVGEVGELVRWMRERGKDIEQSSLPILANYFAQAADLIEQRQAAPVPVALSERLPVPEDCDAEGRCWFWQTGTDGAGNWELCAPCYYPSHYQLHGNTHWLPAYALPLPSGEVSHG